MAFCCKQLVIASLAAFFLLAGTAAAQNGTIKGQVKPAAQFIGGSARAYSLEAEGSYSTAIPRNGRYQLSLPQGPYVVVGSTFGRRNSSRQIDVVRVRAAGATSIRPRRAKADAAAAVRASVGNVQILTGDGAPITNPSGKPIVWDDLLINELLNAKAPCKISVYEDREFGRFDEILKELRFQSSRFAANRINYKKALRTLRANEPQYRVSGQIFATPDMNAPLGNASVQITDLRTGEVVWSSNITGVTDLFGAVTQMAGQAATALCIPRRITGTFTGIQRIRSENVSVDYTWAGEVTFVLTAGFGTAPTGDENVAIYFVESGKISSINVSGTVGACTESGSVSNISPSEMIGIFFLWPELQPEGYRYMGSADLREPEALPVTAQCPEGGSTEVEQAFAELQMDNSASFLVTDDPRAFRGTRTYENTTISWDLAAAP